MPDGRTHSLATLSLAAGAIWGLPRLGMLYQPLTFAVAGGCLAGLFLSPDLDVNTGSMSDDWARHTIGRLPAGLWWLLWRPYAWLVPHRSPLSHWPLLGTVLRLGYLWGMVYLIATVLHRFWPVSIPHLTFIPWWLPWAFIGLASADLIHWVLDNTVHGPRRQKINKG